MADNQWQELMQDWQTTNLESGQQQPTPDMKLLEQKTRRKALNMSIFMWLDVIAGIFFVGFFLYMLVTNNINLYQTIIFAGVSFVIVPMVIYSVWIRRGLWHANGTDTHAYLILMRDRAMAGMRLAQVNVYVSFFVFPFIIAVFIWRMFASEAALNWPLNALVFVTLLQLVLFATIYIGAKHYYRVKEKEYQQTTKLLDELEES
ncbi:MAG: hypothetical protein KJO69_06830 [Gammaproteobacteria bacterium]|nr:hypothetical protein [Gammaproteobacteria bacterium]NNJ72175.1 hypothetical protein [Enterobacterales bacterium]